MYLIKNGTVYTMGKDGVVHTDLLLNDDGKIEAEQEIQLYLMVLEMQVNFINIKNCELLA